jgi:ribosomal 30S subunit maturation factor RimM
MVFTYFLFIGWAKIKISTKRKMAREEKHWKVVNSDMTLSHKWWEANLQCRGEIQMKNLFIIMFCKIDNKKIEEKTNAQKIFTIVLFDFATFKCYLLLLLLDAT